jgi:Tripartite tricarboxylate transporter TctB family
MKLTNHRDLWAGLMFTLFGLIFVGLSTTQYNIGTAAKMGPGYFPATLGSILTLLGLIIVYGAFSPKNEKLSVEKFDFAISGYLLGAVALFGLCLAKLGVIVSIVALIFVSSLASHEFRLRDTIISAVVLLVMSYVVFVWGLELQFPVLPFFMTK